jgi:hypothetical protein
VTERFHEVRKAFQRYSESVDGDQSETKAISDKDIEFAIMKHSSPADMHTPWFMAMKTDLANRKEDEYRGHSLQRIEG